MKCTICSNSFGKSFEIANMVGWPIKVAADGNIELKKYNLIHFICANYGDEELQPEMEKLLISIKINKKPYVLLEIGNSFGEGKQFFGCLSVAKKILSTKKWNCLASYSLDAFPDYKQDYLNYWIATIKKLGKKYE